MDFVGKVVIVTGAAKGMGFGAAVKFANEGASVGLVDNDVATLATVEKNFLTSGKKVKAFPTKSILPLINYFNFSTPNENLLILTSRPLKIRAVPLFTESTTPVVGKLENGSRPML